MRLIKEFNPAENTLELGDLFEDDDGKVYLTIKDKNGFVYGVDLKNGRYMLGYSYGVKDAHSLLSDILTHHGPVKVLSNKEYTLKLVKENKDKE